MNLLRSARNLLSNATGAVQTLSGAWKGNPLFVQRKSLDAAASDRTTEELWDAASIDDINQFLLSKLELIRRRAIQEVLNNGIIEGIIDTHVISVVGKEGPTPQIISDIEYYNDALQEEWSDWFLKPDVKEELSGIEMLDQWVRQFWDSGEFLCQITDAPDAGYKDISLRLDNINARRLSSPYGINEKIFMGIALNDKSKKEGYWIKKTGFRNGLSISLRDEHEYVKTEYMIHGYKRLQPGQLRGLPWLTTNLDTARNLRDFEKEVMKAARAAAMLAVLIHSDDAAADPVTAGSTMRLESGYMGTLPPGYKATQIAAQQPSAQFVEYTEEQYRKIGRVGQMPLMMIKLDSSKHSFSSARFDNQLFITGNNKIQGGFETSALNIIMAHFEREAFLKGKLGTKRPKRYKIRWTWPKPPSVDPLKEALAKKLELQIGDKTFKDLCAANGLNWQDVINQLGIEVEAFANVGITHLFGTLSNPKGNATTDTSGESNANATTAKPKKKKKKEGKVNND